MTTKTKVLIIDGSNQHDDKGAKNNIKKMFEKVGDDVEFVDNMYEAKSSEISLKNADICIFHIGHACRHKSDKVEPTIQHYLKHTNKKCITICVSQQSMFYNPCKNYKIGGCRYDELEAVIEKFVKTKDFSLFQKFFIKDF